MVAESIDKEQSPKSYRSRQAGPSAKKKGNSYKKEKEKHQTPKVGKPLLIKTLVKHDTKHKLPGVRGKQRKLQFVECPNDIHGIIDAMKWE